jgi:3-methyladenine DNA glycosylase AlkD
MTKSDISNILTLYKAHRNPEVALKMAAYMKNKFLFLGIQSPLRADLNKEIIQLYGKVDFESLEAISTELWDQPEREFQYLAMSLIEQVKKKLNPSHLDFLINLVTYKSWWDSVDGLAPSFIGQILKDYPELIDEYLPQWLDSNNIWLNRTAILFQLKYKTNTDFDLQKSIIEQLKHKNDFFVKKAIGWSLREYSKTNPKLVKDYILTAGLQPLSEKEGLKIIDRLK